MKILLLLGVLILLFKNNTEGLGLGGAVASTGASAGYLAVSSQSYQRTKDYLGGIQQSMIDSEHSSEFTEIGENEARKEERMRERSRNRMEESESNEDDHADKNKKIIVIIKYILLTFFFLMFGVFVGYKLKDPK